MKTKKVGTLVLAGVLTLGALGLGSMEVLAKVSGDKIEKNVVMTEEVASKSSATEEKYKDIAVKAFKKYFNEDVNAKNLKVNEANLKNQKAYLVGNQDGENYYLALIDSANDKILHLQASHGEPKNGEYKNYPLEDAKKLASEFIKNNNILGKDYELSKEAGKELNEDKDLRAYFFYFNYEGNKQALVTVDKENKKVDQFILLDEQNGPREEDKVKDSEIKSDKEKISNNGIAIEEAKLKEVAKEGFKKYFDESVNVENLDIQIGQMDNNESYFVYYNDGKRTTSATIDSNYNIFDIQPDIKWPEGDAYQNYTYDEAKKVVIKYIEEKNIIGKNYTLLENEEKEQNIQKEPIVFFFPIKDKEGNRVMITVDKNSEKVSRIIFNY